MKARSIGFSAAIFAMIFSAAATAAPNKKTIQIPFPTMVGSSITLQPGEYRIEWRGVGPDVQVNFLLGNKSIVTVPAKFDPVRNRLDILVTCPAESGMLSLVEIETNSSTLHFAPCDVGGIELTDIRPHHL
jgi:hypothetical protein